jgi:hypothetical protein
MPAPISNLSEKILASRSFQERFHELQRLTAQRRLSFAFAGITPEDSRKLFLQISALALSDDFKHARIAQKMNALMYESLQGENSASYAVQIIASRLGNFPVISGNSQAFADRLIERLQDPDSAEYERLDPELISTLHGEEESSRMLIKSETYYFNIFQKNILDALDEKSLVSFSAPTSFGKSYVVRHHIARFLVRSDDAHVLIIVPTKALIDDFFISLSEMKKRLSMDFKLYTNTRQIPEGVGGCVFVLTQERLSFLLAKDPEFVRTFQLIYTDEAHYISRGYRGFVLRDVLRRVINLCGVLGSNGAAKYIFSSPIIKNPQYYKDALFPDLPLERSFHKEIRYSPVEKNIHFIKKDRDKFQYFLLEEGGEGRRFKARLVDVGHRFFPETLAVDGAREGEIHRDIYVVLHSHLAEQSILYASSPLLAHRYAMALAQQLPELAESPDLADLRQYVKDHYGEDFGIADLLKKGIGLHYGPMPLGLRREMVDRFERGQIRFLICTSTLLEGVNLPAKNIFLFSTLYTTEKHSALSFWNLIGRAGRITYGLSGNVFLVANAPEKYKKLIENSDSQIDDPEEYVVKGGVRMDYLVRSFLVPADRFKYIFAKQRDDIEYLIFELMSTNNLERLLEKLNLDVGLRQDLIIAIQEQKRSLSVPQGLILSNPGFDPRLLDKLFLMLRDAPQDQLAQYFSLISDPWHMSGSRLLPILEIMKETLGWPQRTGQIADRIVQWLHELSTPAFIQQLIRHMEAGTNFNLSLLRIEAAFKVIRLLEQEISFKAPKYLKCFLGIARHHVERETSANQIKEYEERIDAFLFALESGVSSAVGKMLFEKGVSRPVAIAVSNLVRDLAPMPLTSEFFYRRDVQERLKAGLSRIALREVEEYLAAGV